VAIDVGTYTKRILPRLIVVPHPELDEPCLIWNGARRGYDDSYGAIWFEGRPRRVHRVAWFLLTGQWPELDLLHECNRRLCCQIAHLREGTHAENMADRMARENGETGENFEDFAAAAAAVGTFDPSSVPF
jgi:hypothetical protein